MSPEERGDWSEYQRLVLSELKNLRDDVSAARDAVSGIKEDMAALKVKAGVWGLMGGAIPASLALLMHFLVGGKKQ